MLNWGRDSYTSVSAGNYYTDKTHIWSLSFTKALNTWGIGTHTGMVISTARPSSTPTLVTYVIYTTHSNSNVGVMLYAVGY